MFVYLSKKIAIPNGIRLRSIAWNHEQGWVACGGDRGLLKVLKLDTSGKGGSNLSMNQSLEGHDAAIRVVAWNHQYRKLTSSDENGHIIVWTLLKGMWYEEMVNNRNRSHVRDLAWKPDGRYVCIVYEDGEVIVGGVDGQRLWGKGQKKQLSHVTWSPNGKFLLFGLISGGVTMHDALNGNFLSKINVQCVDESTECHLAGLQWFTGPRDPEASVTSLAICYETGRMQLMRDDSDEKPVILDCGLRVSAMEWSPNGSGIAVSGIPLGANDDKSVVIQFFGASGEHQRVLRIAGSFCGGLSWEAQGLRIALTVDSFIYFANIRPVYKYAYFNSTVVYGFTRPEYGETCVMYWNIKNHERNHKSVRHLTHVKACGDACILVSKSDDQTGHYMLQLTNSIGGPIETKYIEINPIHVAMCLTHVVACSEEHLYLWQYRQSLSSGDVFDPVAVQQSRDSKERLLHIDDVAMVDSIASIGVMRVATQDPIRAAAISPSCLVVGRESAILHIYSVEKVELLNKVQLTSRPQMLSINCDSTMLSTIDPQGVLQMMPLDPSKPAPGVCAATLLAFERKDIWEFLWAEDNPESFLVMEKARMYIFRGLQPEEPVVSSAQPCKFKSLKIRSVVLDDILGDPEKPTKESLLIYETKALRDAREIIQTVNLKEAVQYIEDNSHPKLWSLLTETSLERLDFPTAERAFLHYRDYPAIQFLKRIKSIDDQMKQRAEVHAYYGRFEEAERIYKEIDRKDLALELMARVGKWFRVVQLAQEGGGDESAMVRAWDNIGSYYADRQKWSQAAQYYGQARNWHRLAQVYYVQEDFHALEQLVNQSAHDKPLLMELGRMFMSVGLADSAAKAYLQAGETRMAVDACVELNQWDLAITLAERHNLSEIGQFLSKYATHLVEKSRIPQAIELYRKAGHHAEAAKLIARYARDVGSADPLKSKKIYVLAALEVEQFREKQMHASVERAVDALISQDTASGSDRTLDAAWRGAEAYHFFMLCQQHLLAGRLDMALNVAMRLMNYDDLINPTDSYSLIALTAYYAKNYAICSQAFTRLELLEDEEVVSAAAPVGQLTMIDEAAEIDVTNRTMASKTMATRTTIAPVAQGPAKLAYPTIALHEPPRHYAALAVKIFTRHSPEDTAKDTVRCSNPKCGGMNREWASHCVKCHHAFLVCVLTGRALSSDEPNWTCRTCHHHAVEREVARYRNCPLCHASRR